jgi:membrane-associated phospholipid phosphatase
MAGRHKFGLKLPLFMTSKLKYPVGGAMFSLAFFLYYVTNHYPYFPPHELPLLAIDRAVPFVPSTVLIYVSEYFFFTTVYIVVRDMENLNKYLYSFFFIQAFSCLIFFLWPTIYPRDLFPIPPETNHFIATIFNTLRVGDAATNCFPSLHVSSVFLSVYIFRDEQREKFPYFLAWGILIALSTLPTKQHYFADVTAGWALSVIVYFVFHRWMPYQKVGAAALVERRFESV